MPSGAFSEWLFIYEWWNFDGVMVQKGNLLSSIQKEKFLCSWAMIVFIFNKLNTGFSNSTWHAFKMPTWFVCFCFLSPKANWIFAHPDLGDHLWKCNRKSTFIYDSRKLFIMATQEIKVILLINSFIYPARCWVTFKDYPHQAGGKSKACSL